MKMSPERLCAQLNGDPEPLGIFVEHGRGKGISMLFHQQIGVGSTHGKQRLVSEMPLCIKVRLSEGYMGQCAGRVKIVRCNCTGASLAQLNNLVGLI